MSTHIFNLVSLKLDLNHLLFLLVCLYVKFYVENLKPRQARNFSSWESHQNESLAMKQRPASRQWASPTVMSSYIAPEESLDLSGLPQEILNTILETKLERRYKVASIEQAKSAQQRVFILKLKPSNDKIEHDDLVGEWKDCLERGRNRLVVREWKGGCQWWNLHRNLDVNHLSHYEMLGYKVAVSYTHLTLPTKA